MKPVVEIFEISDSGQKINKWLEEVGAISATIHVLEQVSRDAGGHQTAPAQVLVCAQVVQPSTE